MIYLFWSLPALATIGAIASGRLGVLTASFLGLAISLAVALAAAPQGFQLADAALALARGAWIGWVVVPYILGGLLFWQVALRPYSDASPATTAPANLHARRRLLFTACFLVGPFAESATGFGVGIMGTMALVRGLQVGPVHL